VNIDTMRFSHILESDDSSNLNYFFARTAFVITHKREHLETLLGVIWYLPLNSPVLIVTNCSETEKEELEQGLVERLAHHRQVYLIHQKDPIIARFFARSGVHNILGADGKVVDGKGEGLYIGTLMASLLGYPKWIVFYDADNFVPNALLEYTLAMSRLFLQEHASSLLPDQKIQYLHNVRICWSSKPALNGGSIVPGLTGRCTRVVCPLLTKLVMEWFGVRDRTIISSNAGEQGFTMETARMLRFSSGYSVETFQLLDLLSRALTSSMQPQPRHILLQQYQAQSPHFHEKRDDEHIKRLVADSLGAFFHFKDQLPSSIELELQQIYEEMNLEFRQPLAYSSLQELSVERNDVFVNQYRLLEKGHGFAEQEAICG
jgi:mannosyl-3-phosphoglycerate synthase